MLVIDLMHLNQARINYRSFIELTHIDDFNYALTPNAESSPYARCFAIFGYGLLQESFDSDFSKGLAEAMVTDLDLFKKHKCVLGVDLKRDKPYLQLLTFTLSALTVIGQIDNYPLLNHIEPFLKVDVGKELEVSGAFKGLAGSGNQAMFLAVVLLYAAKLGFDTSEQLDLWCQLHVNNINKNGFWGDYPSMSHLQFQNGYHQYEIFDYLNITDAPWSIAADAVANVADKQGHFAPYPGGGGCYDYDAIFFLTAKPKLALKYSSLLSLTAKTIISEQNDNGGFCESKFIRPRRIKNVIKSIHHSLNASGLVRFERIRQALTLLRPKHNRISTHWSTYSREWGESDLWDSWFRMLTLARIDCAFSPSHAEKWGFINFPGIGFHRSNK